MKTDASPETIGIVGEALKLASLLDDRVAQPDKARVLAWAEQLEKYQLLRKDVLDGLQQFYDSPRERAIQVGDLIHHARVQKRLRLEKQEAEDVAQREAASEAKAEDDIKAVTAGFLMGRVKDTPRLRAAREALQNCRGRRECGPAIAEYNAAKAEAVGRKPKKAA
jgi:hypothetical protein